MKDMNDIIRTGTEKLAAWEADLQSSASQQEKQLLKMLDDNKDTEYGRKYHFAEIRNFEEYKKNVPLSVYDDVAPYINRMTDQNEKKLLTVYPIAYYAVSSGTTGKPKHVPVSEAAVKLFDSFISEMPLAVMDRYFRNTRKTPLTAGHILTTAEIRMSPLKNGVLAGPISSLFVDNEKDILTSPREVYEPRAVMNVKHLQLVFGLKDRDVTMIAATFSTQLVDLMSYMKQNWQSLTDDIEKGCISTAIDVPADIRASLNAKLTPDPVRAAELREIFEKGFDTPVIRKIWKKIEFIWVVGTVGFAAYMDRLRQYSGDIPVHLIGYTASEVIMAVPTGPEIPDFQLVPQSGFYEFIPVSEDGKEGKDSLMLDQLEVGKKYELILTNLSGFYRYRTRDVIKVTGYSGKVPLIQFAYRTNQLVSIAGEKTSTEQMKYAVDELAKHISCPIIDYSVYPNIDVTPGRYEIVIEPQEMLPLDKLPGYADFIEQKLSYANPSFGRRIVSGAIGKTALYMVEPQTYALYREMLMMKGVLTNQLKPVRIIDTKEKKNFFFSLLQK